MDPLARKHARTTKVGAGIAVAAMALVLGGCGGGRASTSATTGSRTATVEVELETCQGTPYVGPVVVTGPDGYGQTLQASAGKELGLTAHVGTYHLKAGQLTTTVQVGKAVAMALAPTCKSAGL